MLSITSVLKTTSNKNELLRQLHELRENLNTDNFDQLLQTLSFEFQEMVKIHCGQSVTVNKINEFIHQIEEIPVISLTVATNISDETTARIHDWVTTHVGEYILDFNFDTELIGGALVTCNGRYLDMSVSRLMKDTLSNEHIYETLFKVERATI